MKRYALLCEYDGSAFHGWQEQKNASSVQETLTLAWKKLCGETISLCGSSRTDAGVSARRHVSDFLNAGRIPAEKVHLALNTVLPESLAVLACREVPDSFQSRFQAVGKLYCYRLHLSSSPPAIFRHNRTQLPTALDSERIAEAMDYLKGWHDFAAMMDQGSPIRDTRREIIHLSFSMRREDSLGVLACAGNGFLYHQIRILTGSLILIGQGKLSVTELKQAMREKNRPALGKTMPPQGLCLERVYYPDEIFGNDGRADYERLRTSMPLII